MNCNPWRENPRNPIKELCLAKTYSKESFIESINRIASKSLATSLKKFVLASEISIDCSIFADPISINSVRIEFLKEFPEKFLGPRNNLLEKIQFSKGKNTKVLVYSDAKTTTGAVNKSLRLNLLRSIINSITSPEGIFFGMHEGPISKVLLGPCHTLHFEIGDEATQGRQWWYQVEKHSAEDYRAKDPEKLNNQVLSVLNRIESSHYKPVIEECFLRYSDACDTSNHNNALIQLWSIFEKLCLRGESNSDTVPQQVAFCYEEYEYNFQVMQHIRTYRNRHVHEGLHSKHAIDIAFMAHHYLRRFIYFHLSISQTFESLAETIEFLKTEKDSEKLQLKIEKLKKALKFINGETVK